MRISQTLIIFFLSFLFLFTPVSQALVINEFLPNPLDGQPEWVELYNNASSSADLAQYTLEDATNPPKSLSGLGTLDPYSFALFEYTGPGWLNNGGDTLTLRQSAAIIDSYQYVKDPGKGISIGRYPDVTGQFTILSSPSPKSSNSPPPTPTPTNTPLPTDTPQPTHTPQPEPTSTPTPTPKPPTSTPTVKPTLTRTPTPKPSPTPSVTPEIASDGASVLGTSAEEFLPTPAVFESATPVPPSGSSPRVLGLIASLSGFFLLGVAGFIFMRRA